MRKVKKKFRIMPYNGGYQTELPSQVNGKIDHLSQSVGKYETFEDHKSRTWALIKHPKDNVKLR